MPYFVWLRVVSRFCEQPKVRCKIHQRLRGKEGHTGLLGRTQRWRGFRLRAHPTKIRSEMAARGRGQGMAPFTRVHEMNRALQKAAEMQTAIRSMPLPAWKGE